MDLGALFHNDHGMFELTGSRCVQPEIALEGNGHVHPFRHVHKGSAGPYCPMEGGELVVRGRNQLHEMLPDNVFIFFHSRIEVGVDDTLLYQFVLDAVVHHFGVILGSHPGQGGLFRFRDSQTVKGVLDVFRQIVPVGTHPGIGAYVSDDVGHIQAADVRTPFRVGDLIVQIQGFQTGIQHPLGFILLGRNLPDHIRSQAGFRLVFVVGVLLEIIHIAEIRQGVNGLPFLLEFLFVSRGFPGQRIFFLFRHSAHPPVISCKRRSRWLRFPRSGKHRRS
ncbi:unknown [Acidaminococcus sp. CAG:542]|nr:unknown [Acidaminococcus sp. CAG:542]